MVEVRDAWDVIRSDGQRLYVGGRGLPRGKPGVGRELRWGMSV